MFFIRPEKGRNGRKSRPRVILTARTPHQKLFAGVGVDLEPLALPDDDAGQVLHEVSPQSLQRAINVIKSTPPEHPQHKNIMKINLLLWIAAGPSEWLGLSDRSLTISLKIKSHRYWHFRRLILLHFFNKVD
jgi:hypothetical protein